MIVEDDEEEKEYSRGRILSKMRNKRKNVQDEKYLKEDMNNSERSEKIEKKNKEKKIVVNQ